jgi:hypothetical protein
MPPSEWNTFLREYRAKHPTLSYKTQVSRASTEYRSKCGPATMQKKLKTATQVQKNKICEVLNLDTNLKPNAKKGVRHAPTKKIRHFKKPGASYYDNPYWNKKMKDEYFDMPDEDLERLTQKEIRQENKQQKDLKKWVNKNRRSNNPFNVLSTLGSGRATGSGIGDNTRFYDDHFPEWYMHS